MTIKVGDADVNPCVGILVEFESLKAISTL